MAERRPTDHHNIVDFLATTFGGDSRLSDDAQRSLRRSFAYSLEMWSNMTIGAFGKTGAGGTCGLRWRDTGRAPCEAQRTRGKAIAMVYLELESRPEGEDARRQGSVEDAGGCGVVHVSIGVPRNRGVDAVELRRVQDVV